jgi:FkbM family methyltransferase
VLGYEIEHPSTLTMRWVFPEIFITRDYEIDRSASVRRIVDAGANIGVAAIFFRDAFPDAEIICFEPDPRAYAYLLRNLERNGIDGVTAYNVALGSTRSSAALYVKADIQDTCQSLSRTFAESVAATPPLEIEVTVAPLSDYVDGPVDLMKIDVEGSELELLRGARDILAMTRQVVMEYHRLPDNPLHEVLAVLADAGHQYEVVRPVEERIGSVSFIRSRRP